MEMSPTPEAALPQGDRLASLVPASGHLLHMATHIDVLCGDYENVHFVAYGAMFLAQKSVALNAALELQELLPEFF
jgi:hypothetical protein